MTVRYSYQIYHHQLQIHAFIQILPWNEVTNICQTLGGQRVHVRGGYEDVEVDKEMDVSEANIITSKAMKLSTQSRNFRGP